MEFECSLTRGKRKERWIGEIHLISRSGSSYEAEITGRGSYFHIVAGKQRGGYYICIPNCDVGGGLASYDDLFWNTEQLHRLLKNKVDAVTVATGLSCLEELAQAVCCS